MCEAGCHPRWTGAACDCMWGGGRLVGMGWGIRVESYMRKAENVKRGRDNGLLCVCE